MAIIRPILFHDIDGVLFGEYDGLFQLRPGVSGWLAWAHEHFEVVWLTSWEREKVTRLLEVLYLRQHTPIQYANWINYESKSFWLNEARQKLDGRLLVWIDDEAVPVDGVNVIRVKATGADALIELRNVLRDVLLRLESAENNPLR